MAQFLTTYQVAQRLGTRTEYVRVLIKRGKLKARQTKTSAHTYLNLVDPKSVRKYLTSKRKPGRPKKK